MAKAANYDLMSKFGLGLVIFGFILQLVTSSLTIR